MLWQLREILVFLRVINKCRYGYGAEADSRCSDALRSSTWSIEVLQMVGRVRQGLRMDCSRRGVALACTALGVVQVKVYDHDWVVVSISNHLIADIYVSGVVTRCCRCP